MTNFPWLTVLVVVPAIGAVAVAAVPRTRGVLAKQLALGVSLVTLVLTAIVGFSFDAGGATFQFAESYKWIPAFGTRWQLGVDGIGLVLIGLTALLTPIVLIAAWNDAGEGSGAKRSVPAYFALMLSLEAISIGLFAATDVFLFYVLFEAMLVPMYFIIGSYGGAQRSYAAVKFLLYSLAGGLLMLAAVIGVYVVSTRVGTGTFSLADLQGLDMSTSTQRWLFLGFFAAFAVKAPMWPVHTWLPDAAAEATPAGAVLLVGILDKVGTFGMIRYCLTLFPDASRYFTPVIVVLAVVGILYAALVAIGQTDMMRLIAYTSVSHFGFMVLGIFAMTSTAQGGSVFYMINHGFATAGLFLVAGFLIQRHGSRRISDYGGIQKVAPVLAGSFLFAGMAGLALPGLSTFVSEFLVLVGTYPRYQVAAVFGVLGIILASIYILWMYQRMMGGEPKEPLGRTHDLNLRERIVVAPIVAVILVLGFFPGPVMNIIDPAVHATLDHVGVTDPVPALASSPADAGGAE